jgi:hypothetical protein
MTRSMKAASAEAEKIAELKRLITNGSYESLEKLEEAVDRFLWGDEEQTSDESRAFDPASLVMARPK